MYTKLGLFLLATYPVIGLAQPAAYPGWQDWPGPWHMWSGGWGFWWIFPLFMMVLAVVFCVFLMTRMGHPRADHAASALQVLNERFAKGEISKEEFEEKRGILVRRV